ncbi:hypothetical protein ACFP3I_23420 [Chryseobacterium arachidis]|uniref:hypothetical protein n=1 Tax=Chryseobacterium arachidis TaxID=1416778 RepID=UPI003612C497
MLTIIFIDKFYLGQYFCRKILYLQHHINIDNIFKDSYFQSQNALRYGLFLVSTFCLGIS